MTLATPQEACREQALNEGREFPERAWILTFFDTWERNPFYTGPPVRHPEDDQEDYDDEPSVPVTDGTDDIPF